MMDIIYLLDLFGTVTFALSGAITAAGRKFDIFGAVVIAFVTAVGGGTVRDMLLGSAPVFWLRDANYFIAIIGAVIAGIFFIKKDISRETFFLIFDAIGIGVFTVIGIGKGIEFGLIAPFCILMGMVTAVVGGVFRDILCNIIPQILQKEIYATACLAGGCVYFLLVYAGLNDMLITVITMGFIITVRLVSVKYRLSLPRTSL